jgi:dTDP-4-dehydrorhamnose 3,5-epimerase
MHADFRRLAIEDVVHLRPRRFEDERGWFSETFSETGLKTAGVAFAPVQDNQSCSRRRGTLRGLHLQSAPFAQAKLVRVLRGAVLDVAVDLRPASSTFGRWVSQELSARDGDQLYVPRGFAHGFLTLEDDTEVLYKVDARYAPDHALVIAWDDPELAVAWPVDAADVILSEADATATSFADWRQSLRPAA